MSLSTELVAGFNALGTHVKNLRTLVTGSPLGDLTGLNTSDKTSLIAALNEANFAAAQNPLRWSTEGVPVATPSIHEVIKMNGEISQARMWLVTAPSGGPISVDVEISTNFGSSWSMVTTLTIVSGSTTQALASGLTQSVSTNDWVRLNPSSINGASTVAVEVTVVKP